MNAMKKTKQQSRSPHWAFSAKIDPDLEEAVRAFIESQEFPPKFTAFIEKAFKEFLEKRNFWPLPTKRE